MVDVDLKSNRLGKLRVGILGVSNHLWYREIMELLMFDQYCHISQVFENHVIKHSQWFQLLCGHDN